MFFNKLKIVLLLACFGLGLFACGDSDTGTSDIGASDKPQSMTPATTEESAMVEASPTEVASYAAMPKDASGGSTANGGLEAYDPDVPSMVVEDNGVVHEEEIYKAWPKHAASVGSTTDGAVEAYDPDVPSMVVEDNGVISEEEIYNNWPRQNNDARKDSTSTESTSEAPAAVAAEVKTYTVFGQATSFSPNILFINPGDTVQWQNMTIHDSVSMEGLVPEGAKTLGFQTWAEWRGNVDRGRCLYL